MSLPKGHQLNTRDKANEGLTGPRPHTQTRQLQEGQYKAIVQAVQVGGYRVGVYDEASNIIGVFDYVRAWPDPGLEIGAKVWIIVRPGMRQPEILGATGGGCGAGLFELGILIN